MLTVKTVTLSKIQIKN